MSLIRYFILLFFILIFSNQAIAEELKKIGKFKDWEVMTIINNIITLLIMDMDLDKFFELH